MNYSNVPKLSMTRMLLEASSMTCRSSFEDILPSDMVIEMQGRHLNTCFCCRGRLLIDSQHAQDIHAKMDYLLLAAADIDEPAFYSTLVQEFEEKCWCW